MTIHTSEIFKRRYSRLYLVDSANCTYKYCNSDLGSNFYPFAFSSAVLSPTNTASAAIMKCWHTIMMCN